MRKIVSRVGDQIGKLLLGQRIPKAEALLATLTAFLSSDFEVTSHIHT